MAVNTSSPVGDDHGPLATQNIPLPEPKPMARAGRVSLFRREIHVGLSSAAVEILFGRASLLSEGQLEEDGYFGSTMITIDCARIGDVVSDSLKSSTFERVAELLAGDEAVRERARQLGAEEAERLAGENLIEPQIDVRVRQSGSHLHIDLDVEATSSRARAK